MTHTYAVLNISPAAFIEIKAALEAVAYSHAFHEGEPGKVVIDMHGIALAQDDDAEAQPKTRLLNLIDEAEHFMCGGHVQTESVGKAIVQEWLRSIRAAVE